MEAKELRIGNLIWDDYSGECKVAEFNSRSALCHKVGFPVNGLFDLKNIEHLRLTEKILLNSGLEKDDYGYHSYVTGFGMFNLEFDESSGSCELAINSSEYGTGCIIKSVHQLQNLYYALTGEELQITF